MFYFFISSSSLLYLFLDFYHDDDLILIYLYLLFRPIAVNCWNPDSGLDGRVELKEVLTKVEPSIYVIINEEKIFKRAIAIPTKSGSVYCLLSTSLVSTIFYASQYYVWLLFFNTMLMSYFLLLLYPEISYDSINSNLLFIKIAKKCVLFICFENEMLFRVRL